MQNKPEAAFCTVSGFVCYSTNISCITSSAVSLTIGSVIIILSCSASCFLVVASTGACVVGCVCGSVTGGGACVTGCITGTGACVAGTGAFVVGTGAFVVGTGAFVVVAAAFVVVVADFVVVVALRVVVSVVLSVVVVVVVVVKSGSSIILPTPTSFV